MKISIVVISLIMLSATGLAKAQLVNPEYTEIGGGFNNPLGVRNAGDGSNRLFVIERLGAIRVIDPSDESTSSLFLDISSKVDTTFEGGLLGLAFHPNFQSNGYFFVNYTRDGSGGDSLTTVIERYQVNDVDSNVADLASAEEILAIGQPAANHNGGDLHFGPDGYLYIGMGDGGASSSTAQSTSNLLGKMLRIDPSIEDEITIPYAIPASNPFVDTATLDEIWAMGLRNPYRWSFDLDTGDMLIADVGQSAREEINFEASTSGGGHNYGWNCREGSIAGPGSCSGAFVDPIIDYTHGDGRCSVTGGYRYRGKESSWYGSYIYSDYCTGDIFIATEDTPGNWSAQTIDDVFTNVLGFGESENGRLFYTNSNGIYEINDADFDGDLVFFNGFE